MTLIFSDKGEILSECEDEQSEQIDNNTVTIRFYSDENGWKFALAVKIERCIRFKPCLKTDDYLSSKSKCKLKAERLINSWLTKPQKKSMAVLCCWTSSSLNYHFMIKTLINRRKNEKAN